MSDKPTNNAKKSIKNAKNLTELKLLVFCKKAKTGTANIKRYNHINLFYELKASLIEKT
jgi:hypothetical protein